MFYLQSFCGCGGGKKFIRYTIPFVIAFVVEIIPYLALHKISLAEALQALFTGGIGPGSYYYPVLVQLIFIFPLLYRIMKKRQAAGLVVVFILNALYETFAFLYGMGDTCYRLLVFRYIFIISAGIYVALYGELRKSVRLASSIIGAIFIVLFGYAGVQSFVVNTSWSGTSYLTVLFIAPIIGHIISKPVQMKKSLLTYLGRASYNIFLFQMVYYATIAGMVTKLVPNIYIRVFVNLFICSVGGVIFYEVEHRITDSVVPKYINSEAPLHEKWDKRLAKLSNAIQK